MSARGPSRHFAPPHDFGRKRSIAEVDGQPSIAEGDANDPKRIWRRRPSAKFCRKQGQKLRSCAVRWCTSCHICRR